jgi:putative membrane protein insertion efficiency factor
LTPKRIALALIAGYKRFISPLLPAACRFEPTCSEYARQAIEYHGLWRGIGLAAWRLLRCQPFSRGGFDPVPCCKTESSHKHGTLAG